MTEKLDREAICLKYRCAYMQAHGKDVGIYRDHGWYYIGKSRCAYRLKQLDEMADELIKRNER